MELEPKKNLTNSKMQSASMQSAVVARKNTGWNREHWQKLEKTAEHVLQEAKRAGASSAEVSLSIDSGLSVTVRLGSVETIEFNHDKALGLTVYRGKSKGSSSTTDFSPKALQDLVEKACRIAEYTETDEAAGLPDLDTLAKNIPELDLYHPEDVSSEAAIAWAKECEDAARASDPRIVNSEGASFASHSHFSIYGNTAGFLGSYPSSNYSMSCVVVGKEKDAMQRDYDFSVARSLNGLDPWQKIGRGAAARTLRRLSGRKIKTCQVPVIFEAPIATGLISTFISAISGGSLFRKSSFLLDHLNKPVFPSFVSIEESPHIRGALGSAPFDNEGVANHQHDIVRDGILQSYVLSTYSARKLGMKTTGNCGGVHNVLVKTSDQDLSSLIKEMDKGLLVTELMGHGINIVTGDYSRGAAGFWVENGEIQYPVEEITIAANLKDMFANLVKIGNDIERRGNIYVGSILLDRMTVAGD